MIGVFVILVLGAIVEAHKHKTTESLNLNSTEVGKDMTNTAYNIEASELKFIQSMLSQLNNENLMNNDKNADGENDEADVASNSSDASDEETTTVRTDATKALETSDYEESDRSSAKGFDTKRNKILEYLSKMLNGDTMNEDSKTNRRLDFEDNGVVDIDNPKSNDYNQDEVVDFRANRRFMGYGTILNTKGRSGHDVPKPINNMDSAVYHPLMSIHGLFFNPGFYQTQRPLTFNKIDNRDHKHPVGRWTNLPFRWLENEAHGTTERAVTSKAQDWDIDSNAYRYEPVGNELVAKLPLSYGR